MKYKIQNFFALIKKRKIIIFKSIINLAIEVGLSLRIIENTSYIKL